jgi:hypothetical protein
MRACQRGADPPRPYAWDGVEVWIEGLDGTLVPTGEQLSFAAYVLPESDEPIEFYDTWVPGSLSLSLDPTTACSVGHTIGVERVDMATGGSLVVASEVSMYVPIPHRATPRGDEADVTIEEL